MSFQLLLFTLSSLGQPSWSEFPIRTCCPPPKLLAIQDLHNSRQRQDKAGQVMTQLLSIDFSIKFEKLLNCLLDLPGTMASGQATTPMSSATETSTTSAACPTRTSCPTLMGSVGRTSPTSTPTTLSPRSRSPS